jgi:hypothetical protein
VSFQRRREQIKKPDKKASKRRNYSDGLTVYSSNNSFWRHSIGDQVVLKCKNTHNGGSEEFTMASISERWVEGLKDEEVSRVVFLQSGYGDEGSGSFYPPFSPLLFELEFFLAQFVSI